MITSIRNVYILFIFFTLILCEFSYAQNVLRGPYLQVGTPTSINVRWRTDVSTNSRVNYGLTSGSHTFSVENSTLTTEHEVTLSGLTPYTKYYYSIGTTSAILAGDDSSHHFITSPNPGIDTPTRIWMLGDSGTKNANARAVRDAYYNLTGNQHTDLWLLLGDNAYPSGEDDEYQLAVFGMYDEMLRKSVLWPSRGNHDRGPRDANDDWTNGGTYYNIFSLPTAGEAGGLASGTEAYYSYDYGNIHFVCLESTLNTFRADTSSMWQWLEDDLSQNNQLWTIAYWHHPPYSKGSHNSNTSTELIEMRERALPIFDAYGVDLVLSGHSHSYERSFLIDGHYDRLKTLADSMIIDGGNGRIDGDGAYLKPTRGSAPHEGTVFIVAGSSGKVSSGTGMNHPVMVESIKTLGSVVVDIDENQLDAQFIDSNGNIQDYFTIRKPTNEIGAPVRLVIIEGNQQIALINTILQKSFIVEVRDYFHNPVAGIPVTFEIISGEGVLSNSQPQITNANGRAETTLTLGSNPDTITVSANAGNLIDSPQNFTTFALSANLPILEIKPVAYNFGAVALGAGTSKTFIVRNIGTLELEVSTLNVSTGDSADFTINSGFAPFNLLSGDSQEVEISFSPASEGEKNTLLRLESNDASNNPMGVTLTGTGIISDLQNTVLPVVSTSPTSGDTDDPAIWIHPTDPSKSVIIGTDKSAGIYVWDMDGNELQNIPQGTSVNNVDVRQNVQFGDQLVDVVAANLRDAGKLAVFKVNPDYAGADVLIQIAGKESENNDIQKDSYGFCLYKRITDGTLFVFERPKSGGEVRQYVINADSTGNGVLVSPVRDLNYNGGVAEGFVADDELDFVYITEEDFAIHKYLAAPDSTPEPLSSFAIGDGTTSDREGLAIYACNDGTGYLVLSNQGNSTIKIYERQGDNKFVKTITPLDDQGNPGLGTDGLDVTSFAAPANFPDGFLVVHDQHGKRFHIYDWQDIAAADLSVCPNSITPLPKIFVTSSTYNFGEVAIDTGVSDTVVVKNIGSADLMITNILLTGIDVSEFNFDSDSTPYTLHPGDSLAIVVSFIPEFAGEKNATLRFESNDPDNNPLDITLLGSGIITIPDMSLSRTSFDFGRVVVDSSASQNIVVKNIGNAELVIQNIILTGKDSSEFKFESVVAPFTINSSDSIAVEVTFTPKSEGEKNTVLRVTSNDPDSNQVDISLTGSGNLILPHIFLSHSSLNFGEVVFDSSASQNIVMKNTGAAELVIHGITLTGQDSSEFSIDSGSGPFTINPGDSIAVEVTFTPESGGEKNTVLRITSNDPDSNQVDISLTGVGNFTRPHIIISYTSINFGDVVVDSTVLKILFVKNTGTADLAILNIKLTGNDSIEFKIESGSGPFSMIAGDSLAVVVGFHPKFEGARKTILRIESNDANNNPLEIQLLGKGKTKDPVSVDTNPTELIPEQFALQQNYPNPFNAGTTIEYAVPEASHVRLLVYNLLGKKIHTLVDKFETPGIKRKQWTGVDKTANIVGSGIYYVVMEAGNKKFIIQMMLLK